MVVSAELPSLVWVIVGGVGRHVSDFAGLPPGRRPTALCPACGRRLSLKLGSIRRHHAAHAPDSVCAATSPETALHLNCKLAIAAALRDVAGHGAALSIVQRCPGIREDEGVCNERRISAWVESWDEVVVEQRVGDDERHRPDILLQHAGAPIAAIEILVSNAVSPEKQRALAAAGVPWIEVTAIESLAMRDSWTVREPLAVARESDGGVWRCEAHAARHRTLVADAAADREAEREAARHALVLRAARVVDVYHGGGERERRIYRVSDVLIDGRLEAIRLQRGGVEVAELPVTSRGDARARAWPLLRQTFAADLAQWARDGLSFTDSPMRWARGDAAENIVAESLADFAGRDPTPLATRFPRRWFYAPAERRWFLPDDMRGVRWDREPLDPFAAHPAWLRHRGRIAERPAPEGSWATPVFASPPLAAMFIDGVRMVTPHESLPVGIVEVAPGRVIVVVEQRVAKEAIEAVATRLAADSAEAVWLSLPQHWTPAFDSVAWAPAGRDWYGRLGVVVDTIGVFTAAQFAQALARGDQRLRAGALREHLRGRVAGLRASFNRTQ